MKYHLHIVDSGGAAPGTSSSSASGADLSTAAPLFFAHFALACGHLYDVLEVSASTASDVARAPAVKDQLDDEMDAHEQLLTEQEAQLVTLQAAAAVLQSPPATDPEVPPPALPAHQREALEGAFLPGADWRLITPYSFFSQPFAKMEALVRAAAPLSTSTSSHAAPPYFSFIAATDASAYEYVVQHYQRLRLHTEAGSAAMAGHRPVAVLHVMSSGIERSCQALVRVIEALLETQLAKVAELAQNESAGNMQEAEEVEDMRDDVSVNDVEWVEKIEEAVMISSQVLGIDVLLTIV